MSRSILLGGFFGSQASLLSPLERWLTQQRSYLFITHLFAILKQLWEKSMPETWPGSDSLGGWGVGEDKEREGGMQEEWIFHPKILEPVSSLSTLTTARLLFQVQTKLSEILQWLRIFFCWLHRDLDMIVLDHMKRHCFSTLRTGMFRGRKLRCS